MYCVTTTDTGPLCVIHISSPHFRLCKQIQLFMTVHNFYFSFCLVLPFQRVAVTWSLWGGGWQSGMWWIITCQHGTFPCALIHTWTLESDVYGAVFPTSFWWGPLDRAPSQPLFCLSLDCRKFCCCCSVTTSCLTLWLCGLQHARLLCPSLSPGICWNSCPWSQCCYPTISSSAAPFSFCPQSFPALRSFPVSQLFTSGGQSIGHLCRKCQAVISSLICPQLISAILFPIMLGTGDFEVLWMAKVLHVFWRLSSSLSLYPSSFFSGLSSRWTREGQGSGLFLEPHGSMTNPLDQSFTDRILSQLHWTNLAAENLPKFCSFLGHNFILWKLHLHHRQGSWCWGKWNLCPKLTEFRREEWRDLNFKAGTLSTRLMWLYRQRNVFEQKNGTKWGSLGISTLV